MFFQSIAPLRLLAPRATSKSKQTKSSNPLGLGSEEPCVETLTSLFAEVGCCSPLPCLKRQEVKCLCGPRVASETGQLLSGMQFSWNISAKFFSLTHVTNRGVALSLFFICVLWVPVSGQHPASPELPKLFTLASAHDVCTLISLSLLLCSVTELPWICLHAAHVAFPPALLVFPAWTDNHTVYGGKIVVHLCREC